MDKLLGLLKQEGQAGKGQLPDTEYNLHAQATDPMHICHQAISKGDIVGDQKDIQANKQIKLQSNWL